LSKQQGIIWKLFQKEELLIGEVNKRIYLFITQLKLTLIKL